MKEWKAFILIRKPTRSDLEASSQNVCHSLHRSLCIAPLNSGGTPQAAERPLPKEAADLLSAGAESSPVKVEDCGEGLWRQVADLDVTGGDTTCPGEWGFTTSPRTGCTKPDNNVGGCSVATFSTSNTLEYSRVCGRITGRSAGSPNGFRRFDAFTANTEVDSVTLVDGVTITHDSPIPYSRDYKYSSITSTHLNLC